MEKPQTVTQGEWPIMELLWESPKTLMELVCALEAQTGWSKSTVTTMVRRMTDKGLILYHTEGRTKIFRPGVSREEVTAGRPPPCSAGPTTAASGCWSAPWQAATI